MNKLTGKLRQFNRDDTFAWACWLVLVQCLYKLRSHFQSSLFRAPGLFLGRGCMVRGSRYISFGHGVRANSNLWLEAVSHYRNQEFTPSIHIGNHVAFSDGVHISAIFHISIGDNTLIGSKVYISDHNHGMYRGSEPSLPSEPPAHRALISPGPVTIGKNVWIGENAVILGGLTVGDGAIIGANAVVLSSVAPGTIVAGAPAIPVKSFDIHTGQWCKS